MSFTAPSSAGTYYYCAKVTDSLSSSASSTGTFTLTVRTVTLVQQVAGASKTDSGTHQFTCAFASVPTSGDLLTVAFTYYASTLPSVTSVADSRGSAFNSVGSAGPTGSTVSTVSYMYAALAGTGTTSDTITVKLNGAFTAAYVTCSEWSGVTSVTPVSTPATNAGTGTKSPLSASVNSFTPSAGDLVYAYVGYTTCRTTSSVTPQYTAGTAKGIDYATASSCTGSYKYQLNEADQYVLSWSGTSTQTTFSIAMPTNPTTGSAGWAEIAVEFDPPPSANAAASLPDQATTKAGQSAPIEAGPLGIVSLIGLFSQLPTKSVDVPQLGAFRHVHDSASNICLGPRWESVHGEKDASVD